MGRECMNLWPFFNACTVQCSTCTLGTTTTTTTTTTSTTMHNHNHNNYGLRTRLLLLPPPPDVTTTTTVWLTWQRPVRIAYRFFASLFQVLQHSVTATVWGFVPAGQSVSVGFNGQSIAATTGMWLDQNTWIAKLPATVRKHLLFSRLLHTAPAQSV